MTWFGWFLVAYWALNALTLMWMIGRPREPLTPGTAVVCLMLFGLLVWGVVAVGTGVGA